MSKDQFDACDFCCNWYHEYENSSPSAVAESYGPMIATVLRNIFGIKRAFVDMFVDAACCGNWKRMHMTNAEKYLEPKTWSKMLLDEVWYCSDRWSWDRVIRTQWIYKRLLDSIKKDDAMTELGMMS